MQQIGRASTLSLVGRQVGVVAQVSVERNWFQHIPVARDFVFSLLRRKATNNSAPYILIIVF
jgi:hypothetical protein